MYKPKAYSADSPYYLRINVRSFTQTLFRNPIKISRCKRLYRADYINENLNFSDCGISFICINKDDSTIRDILIFCDISEEKNK